VLFRAPDGSWNEPSTRGYVDEDALQALLAAHPDLLPGVTGDSAVCREFQSGVGPADLVVVDTEGSITLVECKLAANREVRREVIGQVLDYASRLWRMPIEAFAAQWTARGGTPLPDVLGDTAGGGLTALADNLAAGRFRIILAVDEINEDLRRIVEYLNAMTVPATTLVAIEFRRLAHDSTEILMPRVYGAELADAKQVSDGTARHRWTIAEYLEWCTVNAPTTEPAVRAFIDQLQADQWQVLGGKAATPSLNASHDIAGIGRKWPVILYTGVATGPVLECRYADFHAFPDVAEGLLRATSIDVPSGIDPAAIRAQDYRKRPSFPINRLDPALARSLAAGLTAWAAAGTGVPPRP
jgi:hypothetical protein